MDAARKALAILDQEGWCKFTATSPAGAHCLGGAWALAHGATLLSLGQADYRPLSEALTARYPCVRGRIPAHLRTPLYLITSWNDHPATQRDHVRALLRELITGEGH